MILSYLTLFSTRFFFFLNSQFISIDVIKIWKCKKINLRCKFNLFNLVEKQRSITSKKYRFSLMRTFDYKKSSCRDNLNKTFRLLGPRQASKIDSLFKKVFDILSLINFIFEIRQIDLTLGTQNKPITLLYWVYFWFFLCVQNSDSIKQRCH